jgi:hypothetical protein
MPRRSHAFAATQQYPIAHCFAWGLLPYCLQGGNTWIKPEVSNDTISSLHRTGSHLGSTRSSTFPCDLEWLGRFGRSWPTHETDRASERDVRRTTRRSGQNPRRRSAPHLRRQSLYVTAAALPALTVPLPAKLRAGCVCGTLLLGGTAATAQNGRSASARTTSDLVKITKVPKISPPKCPAITDPGSACMSDALHRARFSAPTLPPKAKG